MRRRASSRRRARCRAYNTYNMGVGMSVVVPTSEVESALEILKANGEDAYVIGEIIKGDEGVVFC